MSELDQVVDLGSVVAHYNELMARSLAIAEGLECYVGYVNLARLSVDGDKAVVEWPEWESGYYAGDGSIQTQSTTFAASLLTMDIAAIAEWSKAIRAEREQKRAQDHALRLQQQAVTVRAQELEALAFLKKKYEGV